MPFATSASSPPGQIKRVMIFIDGQNIACRYKEMKQEGREDIAAGLTAIDDTFIWRPINFEYPNLIRGGRCAWDITRVYYYTYFEVDPSTIKEREGRIKDIRVFTTGLQTLSPVLFRKDKGARAVKGDDIALTVEALHHAYNHNVDVVHIITGDGDYVPVIKEIKHLGVNVFVSAFSKGLNAELKKEADFFFNLDDLFFRS